jgi:endoglucanase
VSLPEPTSARLPRWRGFNLLEKFNHERNRKFEESDFEIMAEWGFNFARLPMSYRCWTDADPANWLDLQEPALREIDQAVKFGREHGIHVNLNFHRAPGYCVNPPAEPLDLWSDPTALDATAFHWEQFARRYKGISNRYLSFDLLNEPANVTEEVYVRVVRRLVDAIREEDPKRLIIADGRDWGNTPVRGLADLGIGQSTRGYRPMPVSHYRASWVANSDRTEPTWPLEIGEEVWDRDRLRREAIEPWLELQAMSVGVHVGEWGAYKYTPHPVVLAWMQDQLELWADAGWGWALWNLRGSFGVLDSERSDVSYESFRGHQLDRRMLELLRETV